jgi:hypothetical protein
VVDFVPERFVNNVVLTDYFPSGLATSKTELGDYYYNMAGSNSSPDWDY